MLLMPTLCGLRASFCAPASPADRFRCCSKAPSARRSAINELPPARAAAVWTAIRQGACYRSLDASLKLWVDLFAAVGARDAERHVRAGTRAVDSAPNEFTRSYALSAAVVGEIALKRPEVGRTACSSCMRRRNETPVDDHPARGERPARRSRRSANRSHDAVAMSTSVGRSTRIRSAGVIPTR